MAFVQVEAFREPTCNVVKYDYIGLMNRASRPISWIKAARKAFEAFPQAVQIDALRALTVAAEGEKADTAKPLQGLGAGVLENRVAAPGRRLARDLRGATRG